MQNGAPRQEIEERVSCLFTPVLAIPSFTAEENRAAKLAQSQPRKPVENGKSQHSAARHFLRAGFYIAIVRALEASLAFGKAALNERR
ncbi:hypothetical protein [Anaerotruncus sp.]|uniref:hypothetical protein n=1 Tax=Anaerotruncus sp. TaxID=1872531 RepID=UPI0025B9CABD|nr:hypothetical protein [Anaerotruncus sp.]